MALPDPVVNEIHTLVTAGFDNHETLYLHLFQTMGEVLEFSDGLTHISEIPPETRRLVREAIEAAFAKRAEEQRTWPSVTDVERLHAAFAELEQQGIAALEHCGVTLQDGIGQISMFSLAREELGRAVRGYCFFHAQDVWRAVREGGLSLAYGEFDGSLDATEIAKSVVEACRRQNFEVEWNGSPETRIHLPSFTWQRRLVPVQESDVQEFLENWRLEIRAGYTPPDEIMSVLEERAWDWFENFYDYGPALLQRLQEITKRWLDEERALETTWTEPTANDRLTAAFAQLNARGILALECLGSTIHDGWGYAATEASATHRGVVFFHREDVADGVRGRGLWLAFGPPTVVTSSDQTACARVASEAISVLQAHGVPCSWSGSIRDRIRISAFEWKKRRWTQPPAVEIPPGSPDVSSKPTLPEPGPYSSAPERDSVRTGERGQGMGAVLRAPRDGRGFDMRRRAQMAEAWRKAGLPGEVQVGHLGRPMIFVRAGEFLTIKPQPAAENLHEEKDPIWLHSLGVKEGAPSPATNDERPVEPVRQAVAAPAPEVAAPAEPKSSSPPPGILREGPATWVQDKGAVEGLLRLGEDRLLFMSRDAAGALSVESWRLQEFAGAEPINRWVFIPNGMRLQFGRRAVRFIVEDRTEWIAVIRATAEKFRRPGETF